MTERQAEIHAFMVECQRVHGSPPTVREIMGRFGLASPTGVVGHFRSLVKKGWVRELAPGLSRRFVAVDPATPDACPCFGKPVEEGGAA